MSFSDRDVRNHFSYLMETHDPERAVILTSILFKRKETEVKEICSDLIVKWTSPRILEG